jgi:hypothetical protein
VKPVLERGPTRAGCATCEMVIAREELRVGEPCSDGRLPNARYRYHHLECAIDANPRLVREILIAGAFDPAIVAEPIALNERLQNRIDAIERAQPVAVSAPIEELPPDPAIEKMLVELEDDPDDRTLLAVLGDALVERGDPRGELIAIDLALEGPRTTMEQMHRRDELRAQLLPRVCKLQDALVHWGIGYIRRVETSLHELAQYRLAHPWRHPSLRLIRELQIRDYASRWVGAFPPTLRRLALGRFDYDSLDGVEDGIAVMPRLESLDLRGHTTMRLRSPRVVRIGIGPTAEPQLDPAALPAVVAISLDRPREQARTSCSARLSALATAGWFDRLRELGLHDVIDRASVDILVAGLNTRRLTRIDVSKTVVPPDCLPVLRAMCDELVGVRVMPTPGARVVHPKLGTGTIIRVYNARLDIEFPDGKHTFREDAEVLQVLE